jgi:hypothetical protein
MTRALAVHPVESTDSDSESDRSQGSQQSHVRDIAASAVDNDPLDVEESRCSNFDGLSQESCSMDARRPVWWTANFTISQFDGSEECT